MYEFKTLGDYSFNPIIFAKIFTMTELKKSVEDAWENRELLKETEIQNVIREVIQQIDSGHLRCAEPYGDDWQINEWV